MSATEPFLEFTLYRVVRSMEPVEEDFWSYAKLGKPLLDPKKEASWKATSFWRTPGQAAKRCSDDFGWFVAQIRFGTTNSDAVKIGHRHADVTLPPDFLLGCVVRVVHKDDVATLEEQSLANERPEIY
jgi:hypothetical protein